MKNAFFILLMMLCICQCRAQNTKVNAMEEVFQYFKEADSKTLAVFDVDMVLVQPSDPAFQMANMKRHSHIWKTIMKEIAPENQMVFLSLLTVDSEPLLIDKRTPEFLQEIMQKGVLTMALTANLTGQLGSIPKMEKWRVDGLKKIGIDFSKAMPYEALIVFNDLASYRGNYSTYLEGMLFVNGTVVSKGDALLSFLKKTNLTPEKIIFIDDREENLKNVEACLQKLEKPVSFHGLHYLGAQEFPSKILSESEFEARWRELQNKAKAYY